MHLKYNYIIYNFKFKPGKKTNAKWKINNVKEILKDVKHKIIFFPLLNYLNSHFVPLSLHST